MPSICSLIRANIAHPHSCVLIFFSKETKTNGTYYTLCTADKKDKIFNEILLHNSLECGLYMKVSQNRSIH